MKINGKEMTIQTKRQIPVKLLDGSSLEVSLGPLPFSFPLDAVDVLPFPEVKNLGVLRDSENKIIKDSLGRPMTKTNEGSKEFQHESTLRAVRLSVYTIYRSMKSGNDKITFDVEEEYLKEGKRHDSEFVDKISDELLASGFDFLVISTLAEEVSSISGLSNVEEIVETDFSSNSVFREEKPEPSQ